MSTQTLALAGQLSDSQLLAQVKILTEQEQVATAVLIVHLAVLNERRLFLREGYSSLFSYCVQVLHLSEYAAYSRIQAARAVLKYPVILDMIADGSVNLTTLGLLVPELTLENHLDLLEQARHRSKNQVQELVAALRPQPPVTASVRKLPVPSNSPASLAVAGDEPGNVPGAVPTQAGILGFVSDDQPERPAAQSPARSTVVAPLAPERYKVQFTANSETYKKLRLAQDLLRHQVPDGNIGEIFDLALTALLRNVTRQKLSATDRPRGDHLPESSGSVSHSRHIPAEVRRSVWARDGGQCAFVADSGHRCTARAFLEFHHVVPHAARGDATVENIQLRCHSHNGYEAELPFRRGHGLPSTSDWT